MCNRRYASELKDLAETLSQSTLQENLQKAKLPGLNISSCLVLQRYRMHVCGFPVETGCIWTIEVVQVYT